MRMLKNLFEEENRVNNRMLVILISRKKVEQSTEGAVGYIRQECATECWLVSGRLARIGLWGG